MKILTSNIHYILHTHTHTHTHISMYQCSILLEGGGNTLTCPGERSLLPINIDCLLQITLCQIIAVCMLIRRHYGGAHIHPAVHAGALRTLRPRSIHYIKVPNGIYGGVEVVAYCLYYYLRHTYFVVKLM